MHLYILGFLQWRGMDTHSRYIPLSYVFISHITRSSEGVKPIQDILYYPKDLSFIFQGTEKMSRTYPKFLSPYYREPVKELDPFKVFTLLVVFIPHVHGVSEEWRSITHSRYITLYRREVVSYLRKNVHWVLVNRLVGLSLPRKCVVRLTDRPNMTLAVDRGR